VRGARAAPGPPALTPALRHLMRGLDLLWFRRDYSSVTPIMFRKFCYTLLRKSKTCESVRVYSEPFSLLGRFGHRYATGV
jgi:hypothetical protein